MKAIFQQTKLHLLLVINLMAFQNCIATDLSSAGAGPSDVFQSDAASIPELYEKIESIANQDLGCYADTDCIAIEVGSKACGGPNFYIVTSSYNDIEQIYQLNQDLVSEERAFEERRDFYSDCQFMEPPEVSCHQGFCRKVD